MSLFTKYPITNLISNGSYTVMIDNSGSGYSAVNMGDLTLTRWREDTINCQYGTYVFIRDIENNYLWSNTYQPTRVTPDIHTIECNEEKITINRSDFGIITSTEITLAEKETIEFRKLTLTNNSDKKRVLELTSFAEVALFYAKADSAHPAFAKMFVESEWNEEMQAIIFARRPRSAHDQKLFLSHSVNKKVISYESNRTEFIGRGNNISNADRKLSGKSGSILDPIFALQAKIEIEPGKSESLVFTTAFSKDKNHLINLVKEYKSENKIDSLINRPQNPTNKIFQNLANTILCNVEEVRGHEIEKNKLTQSGLWRFGVSGDLPIIVLNIDDKKNKTILNECIEAHHYIKNHGLNFDLVIIGEEIKHDLLNKRGGIFCPKDLSVEEKDLLNAVARAVLQSSNGSLSEQLNFASLSSEKHNNYKLDNQPEVKKENHNYEFFNGIGGFLDNGNTYQIENKSPQPWSNIIANPEFGFIATESGGGYTWSENSRENRLTPWQNDPTSDSLGEVIYIKENNKFWCPTPKPLKNKSIVRHGLGFSEFKSDYNQIESILTLSGATKDKVKWWSLKLRNNSKISKKLEVYLYLDLVLGVLREDNNRLIVSSFETDSEILCAKNSYNGEFAGRTIFVGSSEKVDSYTTSKFEFIGRYNDTSSPIALSENRPLSNKSGSGYDSCAALKTNIELAPNQEKEVLYYLGEEKTLGLAKTQAKKYSSTEYRKNEFNKCLESWQSLLSKVQVKTPNRSFDIMLNTWILYQTLTCRLFARSAYYQSGGAIGFRDQLQDVMALLHSSPEIAKKQIILHASRQFIEGDVQHWWHPPGGKGVRTRMSDDYLWLPYVTHKYIEVTGDKSILNETAPYLGGPKLKDQQMEEYMMPFGSDKVGSIYEHCVTALKHALNFGVHNLPLMGGGDWNDGMNEVGAKGKGESVWLAWFLSDCLFKFKDISKEIGDLENAKLFEEVSKQLIDSIDKHAWDGNWYLRAFFDDGTPMGSHKNDECIIDSLSQSWSVITGRGNKERSIKAMEEIRNRLVDRDKKIICLLTPPFHSGKLEPGYIKGYLKGIRENGGQYTHAAAWTIMATALEGKGKEAVELFSMINPINHTLDTKGCNTYKTEPYVYCGDVYSNPELPGHGGWSWYTGSAGWLYQVGLEYILGLKVHGDYLTINPCIDPSWKEFSIKYKNIKIEVKNPKGATSGVKTIEVDGKAINENKIKIADTKTVLVYMS